MQTRSGIGKIAEIPVTIITKDHTPHPNLLESGLEKNAGALKSTLSVLFILIYWWWASINVDGHEEI